MKKKEFILEVGDNLTTKRANWKFDSSVASNFNSHISRSVPLYETGHEIIKNLSDYFLFENSICYDLGCSTGSLLATLASYHEHKPDIEFIGIDSSKSMIEECKNRHSSLNIKFINEDIRNIELENSDLIISNYTLQFIRPKDKQKLVDKVYSSLNWGGAFILFEKVRACDARFQDIITSLYNDYKLSKGYRPDELIAKSQSLKGVLEPFSTEANFDMLKRAGFVDMISVFKYLCFEGFLAIK